MDTHARRLHVQKLSISELSKKTEWIRDVLEPDIAIHGPEHLPPDTILELATFFAKLLAHSRPTPLSAPSAASPAVLAEIQGAVRAPSLTFSDIQASRIHRAVLLITGPGTRWPMKLLEICDSLIKVWTARFGNLEDIRPLLYEQGGRLHSVKEEKEMGRRALLVKWLSDRRSLVSPLRALEWGHLEFEPGHPDPQGGIVADGDGAYAIVLTGEDEIENDSAISFTYHIRRDDKGKHRLLQAFMFPSRPIRVLRSHTLLSSRSPIVGLRYDGLYKISGYSVSTNSKRQVCYRVEMRREPEQISMEEVQKHPTAEEIEDYREYKRLRSIRLKKGRDTSKLIPKADQVLGVIHSLQEVKPETEVEQDPEDPNLGRRGAIVPEDRSSLTEDEIKKIIAPKSSESSLGSVQEILHNSLLPLDGPVSPSQPNSVAHLLPPESSENQPPMVSHKDDSLSSTEESAEDNKQCQSDNTPRSEDQLKSSFEIEDEYEESMNELVASLCNKARAV